MAVHDESLGGDPDDFSIAVKLGLAVEDHLSLHGITKSSRDGKRIVKSFEERTSNAAINDEIVLDDEEPQPSEDSGTQFTLDSY